MKRWLKWTLGITAGLVRDRGGTFAWMVSQLPPDLAIGAPLPAASLRDLEGRPIDLSSFRGRPLFLDFWRST